MSEAIESRRHKVVVVVDDSAENLLFIVSLIERHGYTVLSASSGQACLSLINRVSPRLILLDVQMPVMDGFETCRRLRTNMALRHVPIAFLTASKTSEDVRAGIGAGGNDFIVKPFDPKKLLERIDYWMSKHIR